jgi:hypothetical protein
MAAHDANYVDAYYGPEKFQIEAKKTPLNLSQIQEAALRLEKNLHQLPNKNKSSLDGLRLEFLQKQSKAMVARIAIVRGEKMSFDQEASLLYDTTPPHYDVAHFQTILNKIDTLLPGDGTTTERINQFRKQFIIPRDKLETVFAAAIQACREQTLKHIKLPEGESFKLEFVTNKPWSGYNWYKGQYQSVIQINVELPIYIERALDIGCHEAYPGHHTYNALLEKNLVNDRKWLEFSVYPLFSPQSLIAEGSANYGIEIAFPEAVRQQFQRDTLFPLAGIDPALMEKYEALLKLTGQLSYAGNEAARAYLDGKITREQAIAYLIQYELYPPEKAPQRTQFYDTYRSYVINYNVGKDLVKDYIERGINPNSKNRHQHYWKRFEQLLSSPRLPSALKTKQK